MILFKFPKALQLRNAVLIQINRFTLGHNLALSHFFDPSWQHKGMDVEWLRDILFQHAFQMRELDGGRFKTIGIDTIMLSRDDYVHPNAKGHAAAGRCIADLISGTILKK